MKKRLFSVLIAIVLICMPVTVFAGGGPGYGELPPGPTPNSMIVAFGGPGGPGHGELPPCCCDID